MRHQTPNEAKLHRHGNIFSPRNGSMIIHAQRENGFAHRTITLQPWQVQVLRLFASRWVVLALAAGLMSWGYFAVQAARVPILVFELQRMKQDAGRLDSLQRTVTLLQGRYEQVQRMLAAPAVRAETTKKRPMTEATTRAPGGMKITAAEEAKKQPD
jgi:hypothetical protein